MKKKNNNTIIYVCICIVIVIAIGVIIGIYSYNNPKIDDRFSYEVKKEQIIDDKYYIEGTVKSNSLKEFNVVTIEFNCYDKDNNKIGIISDEITHLESEGTWDFNATGNIDANKVDHCDVTRLFAGENNNN